MVSASDFFDSIPLIISFRKFACLPGGRVSSIASAALFIGKPAPESFASSR